MLTIFKLEDPEEMISALLRHYKYIGDLPDFDEFKKTLYQYTAWNRYKKSDIEYIYEQLKLSTKSKIHMSDQDYEFFVRKHSQVKSPTIKKHIEKLFQHRLHNNVILHKQRDGKARIDVEKLGDGIVSYPEPEGYYGLNYYNDKSDIEKEDPVFVKTVSRDDYRKLKTISKKSEDFELIKHIDLGKTAKVLDKYGYKINPRQLQEISCERIFSINEVGKLIIYNKIPTSKQYREKLQQLKRKYIQKLSKNHLIIYKSRKSLTELLKQMPEDKTYKHKQCETHTIYLRKPELFNLKTLKPSDEGINLINEFEQGACKYSLEHIEPKFFQKVDSNYAACQNILAKKKAIELKHCNRDDVIRVLTYNGDIDKYNSDLYVTFIHFFLTFAEKNELLEKMGLKQLYENFSFGLLAQKPEIKEYLDDIYFRCFNPSLN